MFGFGCSGRLAKNPWLVSVFKKFIFTCTDNAVIGRECLCGNPDNNWAVSGLSTNDFEMLWDTERLSPGGLVFTGRIRRRLYAGAISRIY